MRIGILGAAGIAGRAVVEPARLVDGAEVVAVAARDRERADAFAATHDLPIVHASYEALLADDSLDAVYVALVNSMHERWTIAALEAGRHVLCEKPFASNASQARAMVAAADRADRVLMEAFHWRFHPVAARMLELTARIQPLEQIDISFSLEIPPGNIRHDLSLAGGSFMDLGSYCVHITRTIAGGDPEVRSASAVEGSPGIDLSMDARLRFDSGIDASIHTSMVGTTRWPEAVSVRVRGRGGRVDVLNPVLPHRGHHIHAELADGSVLDEELEVTTTYEHQLRASCALSAASNRC